MDDAVSTGLEVAGLACVTAAAFTVSLGLGLCVAGACLFLVGYLLGR